MEKTQTKIQEIELPEAKYRLTKIHDDGTYEYKETGALHVNPIKVGGVIRVGGFSSWWQTSMIQEIEVIGKGIRVLTLNSVYLLERE